MANWKVEGYEAVTRKGVTYSLLYEKDGEPGEKWQLCIETPSGDSESYWYRTKREAFKTVKEIAGAVLDWRQSAWRKRGVLALAWRRGPKDFTWAVHIRKGKTLAYAHGETRSYCQARDAALSIAEDFLRSINEFNALGRRFIRGGK